MGISNKNVYRCVHGFKNLNFFLDEVDFEVCECWCVWVESTQSFRNEAPGPGDNLPSIVQMFPCSHIPDSNEWCVIRLDDELIV